MEVLKTIRALAVLLLTIVLAASSAMAKEEDHAIEYQVKAAFLYNFLKFIEWPASPENRPWQIGVAGPAELVEVLEDTVRGKVVNGRPVNVTRLANIIDARNCHIVYLASSVKGSVGGQTGVLTVGEDPHFLSAGGILNFYLEDNKVRFEINPEAAKSAGLHVSAQLLKLGRVR